MEARAEPGHHPLALVQNSSRTSVAEEESLSPSSSPSLSFRALHKQHKSEEGGKARVRQGTFAARRSFAYGFFPKFRVRRARAVVSTFPLSLPILFPIHPPPWAGVFNARRGNIERLEEGKTRVARKAQERKRGVVGGGVTASSRSAANTQNELVWGGGGKCHSLGDSS